ncbi:MAG: hypothetical protein ACF8QF_08800 [Phycisphaerales bacterium]
MTVTHAICAILAQADPAPEQADQALDLLRLSWLLLGLTVVGVFGVILLAVLRRAYLRSHRPGRSPDEPAGPRADSDAWSESGKRIRVETPPPTGDET